MEIWIRSQDKNCLIPINDIISVFQGSLFYKGIILGQYKTTERALEVLDEIQSKLKQQFLVKTDILISNKEKDMEEIKLNHKYNKDFIMQDSGFEITPVNKDIIVYEMPEK